MANYKAIHGFTLQTTSSEPSNPVLGQMWYNSTLGKLRVGVSQAASWSTGGNLTTERSDMSSAGTKAAALGYGGNDGGTFSLLSETYDGSAWTEGSDLNTATNRAGGCGTTTAALLVGGQTPPPGPATISAKTEEYNGASWTEVTAQPSNSYSYNQATTGLQTAALVAGGGVTASHTNEALEYDGTSWTEGGDLNTGRGGASGVGTQTAGLCITGNYAPTPSSPGNDMTNRVEDYNGTGWTETGDLPTGGGQAGSSGTTSSAINFGGKTAASPPGVSTSNTFDGTSWTAAPALPQVINNITGTGTTVGVALGCGGYKPLPGGYLNLTVEYEDVSVVGGSVTTS